MSFSLTKASTLFLSSLLTLFSLSPLPGATSLPVVGVTFSPRTPHHPPPEHVAFAVDSLGIDSVRLPEPDPLTVRAFAYSNTSLLLSVPNYLIPSIAANRSAALRWLYRHVVPFYPRAHICTISVGNNILDNSSDLADLLLPAIRNIHLGLRDIGIRTISVSSTFSFINIMTTSFPPSAAEFQEPAAEILIKPLLQFLEDTNSSFLINLYPYNVYRLHSEIPIGYALFQENPFNFRDDLLTGVRYRNLFDMMVDSVISAMAVAGHENIPVVVTETGWPSSGEDGEVDANWVYAELYVKGLVRHLRSGLGTPLRKEGLAATYIYELLDREVKQGSSEAGAGRQWGILFPNMTKKYSIQFSRSDRIGVLLNMGWCSLLAVAVLI
ncbi:glucan endo-1,3-beta-glucosidase 2 [Malania oleifera]|uniref:glucan endo-1,3-beta-glucosidase 2 n=1 Tax=Malania oleifera TaxID=397392 RepID=UPI0025AE3054|nr:glucan endo-1,3-beta-glucosidase 2 [Malania oleifera]